MTMLRDIVDKPTDEWQKKHEAERQRNRSLFMEGVPKAVGEMDLRNMDLIVEKFGARVLWVRKYD
jgi:hypothetical protein